MAIAQATRSFISRPAMAPAERPSAASKLAPSVVDVGLDEDQWRQSRRDSGRRRPSRPHCAPENLDSFRGAGRHRGSATWGESTTSNTGRASTKTAPRVGRLSVPRALPHKARTDPFDGRQLLGRNDRKHQDLGGALKGSACDHDPGSRLRAVLPPQGAQAVTCGGPANRRAPEEVVRQRHAAQRS